MDIVERIQHGRLQLAGHVVRMPKKLQAKSILHRQPGRGRRLRKRPRTRWLFAAARRPAMGIKTFSAAESDWSRTETSGAWLLILVLLLSKCNHRLVTDHVKAFITTTSMHFSRKFAQWTIVQRQYVKRTFSPPNSSQWHKYLRHPRAFPSTQRCRIRRRKTCTATRRIRRACVSVMSNIARSNTSSSTARTILVGVQCCRRTAVTFGFQQNFPPNERCL